ncbi:hypothetical protein Pla52o_40740 [Novipirellula galeiformis]|uniref:Uncharacterized protein n=1 Tax=Novipirellula galeiformis TaxID=2528004 RepID=A0A5C6CA75_9BACT|nr:hypothetical protein [Novipirellula galeiformis]TWU21042.1 hypothetical protein Pla52o_40740 [Novipirellula galeiformis]
MGQLKEQLAGVLRYGFWIGVGFVTIASLLVWFLASSTLQKEADEQQSKINTAFTSVASLQGELSSHPNAASHAKMESLIETRENEVLKAWTDMYARQRNLLTWPKELQQDFVDEFKDLIPIERYVHFPAEEGEEKPPYMLNLYRYYIGMILPEIATIARAEWKAPFDPTFNPSMDDKSGIRNLTKRRINISGTENKPLVEWSAGSQQQLLADLFPWRGSRPSTLQVYYSQENVWILKQMLQIIDTVNIDAKEAFEAKIREIKTIKIGRSVQFNPAILKQVASQAGGQGMGMGMGMDGFGGPGMDGGMGGMGGMDGGMGGMGGMDGGMGGMGGMDGGMGAVEASDPGDNRYVDTDYLPITGSALRAALDSDSPADVNLAVAKRVPVMMALRMDQRMVPRLLAVCGNAPLMIEVKQVRLLPVGGSAVPSSGGAGGMGGMDEMGGMGVGGGADAGGFGGPGMGGPGMGAPSMGEAGMDDAGMGTGFRGGGMNRTAQTPAIENPYDIDVEVYGLIQIYNPPDKKKLGVDQVTQETVVEGLIGDKPTSTTETLPTPATSEPAAPAAPATPATPATPAGEPVAPENGPAAVDPAAGPPG